jgi:hypothetical protein
MDALYVKMIKVISREQLIKNKIIVKKVVLLIHNMELNVQNLIVKLFQKCKHL